LEVKIVPSVLKTSGILPGIQEIIAAAKKTSGAVAWLTFLDEPAVNVLQAAQLLQIPRGTLRYKMEKLGIG
jgi:DNA-binding NtrC family response regulator